MTHYPLSKGEILVILDSIRSEEELFDPDVVVAHQQATAEIDQ